VPTNRIVPVRFEVIEAVSKTGNAWLKLAAVSADGTVEDADSATYLVQMRAERIDALIASLRPMAESLLAAKAKLATAAPVAPAPVSAPVADTRVDALSAKVDALTDAMTALAQLVARNAAPAPEAPAPARNGRAKPATAPVAPAPATADPFADLPF
jgi:cob(I)alamin adenosyltransferase